MHRVPRSVVSRQLQPAAKECGVDTFVSCGHAVQAQVSVGAQPSQGDGSNSRSRLRDGPNGAGSSGVGDGNGSSIPDSGVEAAEEVLRCIMMDVLRTPVLPPVPAPPDWQHPGRRHYPFHLSAMVHGHPGGSHCRAPTDWWSALWFALELVCNSGCRSSGLQSSVLALAVLGGRPLLIA